MNWIVRFKFDYLWEAKTRVSRMGSKRKSRSQKMITKKVAQCWRIDSSESWRLFALHGEIISKNSRCMLHFVNFITFLFNKVWIHKTWMSLLALVQQILYRCVKFHSFVRIQAVYTKLLVFTAFPCSVVSMC